MNREIPGPVIAVTSKILADRYTETELETMLACEGISYEAEGTNKQIRLMRTCRALNDQSKDPLRDFGKIIRDFMDSDIGNNSSQYISPNSRYYSWSINETILGQELIDDILRKEGLSYIIGGKIASYTAAPTQFLQEITEARGLEHIDIEIKRALRDADGDPARAATAAVCALEAALKTYLDHNSVAYSRRDALASLWAKVADHIGASPKKLDNPDIRNTASALYTIVKSLGTTRNTGGSGAHGESGQEARALRLQPRHARLLIHSAHTLCIYILELIRENET
jgi:hypothetical protein